MAYPYVHISNSTSHSAKGTVTYASAFCSDDDWSAGANDSWDANSRGVCLVTQIDATVREGDKNVQATPYTSSGTSYSQFAVIQIHEGYAVTRIVS